MVIHIHKGATQIGGNFIKLKTANTTILVDAGMPLDFEDMTFEEQAKIKEDAALWLSTVEAVFISHAHADHYGLLNQLDKKIPVFMSEETKVLLSMNPFCSVNINEMNIRVIPIRSKVVFKDFTITAYHVDHSAFGACAFLFEADDKSILYSGDIRLHGPKGKLYRLLPRNVDYMLLEGTNIELEEECKSEREISRIFTQEFISHPETLHTIWCSGQNIDRIVAIYKACKRTNKILVIDPYTAVILKKIAGHNSKIPNPLTFEDVKVYFPRRLTSALAHKHPTNFTIELQPWKNKISYEDIATNPKKYVMTVRESVVDFMKQLIIRKVPIRFTVSKWEGYWNSPKLMRFKTFIEQNCQQTPIIHTSGHSDVDGLRSIVRHVRPRVIIPIHTYAPNLFKDKIASDTRVWCPLENVDYNL